MKKIDQIGGTRAEVLETLKCCGPQRADAIAERLSCTAMAVRQHLYGLREAGLVSEATGEAERGRPPKLWALTEQGHALFPDRHGDVAVQIVDAARDAFGAAGLERLLALRTARQRAGYRNRVGTGSLAQRVAALAQVRSEEGYMAEVQRESDGALLLIEHHCPICMLAKSCSGLCAQELQLFQDVLGPDCSVERTEHVIRGGRRCTYRVAPVNRASAAGL